MNLQRRHVLQTIAGLGATLKGWNAQASTAPRTLWGYQGSAPPARLYGLLAERMMGKHPDLTGRLAPAITAQVGNSGLRAMEAVAKSAPDGRTLLLASTQALTLTPQLKQLKFNPLDVLQPVVRLFEYAPVFCVGPAVPAVVRDLRGYAAWVRDNPARNPYGVPALASAAHFLGQELARGTDLRLQATGYQGTSSLIEDLLNGQIPAAVLLTDNAPLATASGQVRLLALGAPERWPGLPEVPTMQELGVSKQRFVGAFGLFAARGTPAALLTPLADALEETLNSPEMQPVLTKGLFRLAGMHPERFELELQADARSWREQVVMSRFAMD